MAFLRALLSRRDWVYLFSLLIPFSVYALTLKALVFTSQPDESELTSIFDLMSSDIFFILG